MSDGGGGSVSSSKIQVPGGPSSPGNPSPLPDKPQDFRDLMAQILAGGGGPLSLPTPVMVPPVQAAGFATGPTNDPSGGPTMGGGGLFGGGMRGNDLLTHLTGTADSADSRQTAIPRLGQPALMVPPNTGTGFISPSTGQVQYGGVGGNTTNFTLPDSWGGGEGGERQAGAGLLNQPGRDLGRGAYSVYERMAGGGAGFGRGFGGSPSLAGLVRLV